MQELSGGRSTPATPTWRVVRYIDSFQTWQRAWERESGVPGVLIADLLRAGSVFVVAGHIGDTVVAGGMLTRSEHAVGISNFFTHPGVVAESWTVAWRWRAHCSLARRSLATSRVMPSM